MAKKDVFRFLKKVNKDSANSEQYQTGLAGEHLIVASYKQMTIEDLEKMRFILNKIINVKKQSIK